MRNLARNIDNDINTLLKIKEKVTIINYIKGLNMKTEFVSVLKYDQLSSSQLLDEDTVYYVVSPEVGQYIEGYIE